MTALSDSSDLPFFILKLNAISPTDSPIDTPEDSCTLKDDYNLEKSIRNLIRMKCEHHLPDNYTALPTELLNKINSFSINPSTPEIFRYSTDKDELFIVAEYKSIL